ncbi:uncharacterized protein MYCFIDRAFT_86164 [Pseudocercospora fijiensis CIRAD86]|uniref:Leo1-like protein n=1 Tax=Pseudocercospora fijiensis (strain CIRAD86) TaxID=383855 RepID=N1Q822_PSEFD|nr:uncharacterized protein MYCFIDRAFT_86164 [Pseudocercospora fijiensis CIRAD86]EME88970.1 hypothetical protein MYCFIDRAFT_86164 [Pseudocercospora fijiensis CIRAD86]
MSAEQSPAAERFGDEDEVLGKDGTTGATGDMNDDDDDDDVQTSRRKVPAVQPVGSDDDEGGDDLFGDNDGHGDAGDGPGEKPIRGLDDEELDSGDDEGRQDRQTQEEAQEQYEEREMLSMDMEVARQPVPEPSDGEMYLLKVPEFMSIEPEAWQNTTFQPPKTDHHSRKPASATFSAFNTAMTTIRWRHSPSDPSILQSNARINRWSDGSITLQLASDPATQYEIDGNPLAPPQRNPIKPTPTSVTGGTKGGRQGQPLDEKYDPKKDAFTYLVAPVQEAEALRVTHKITAGLSIKQTENVKDDAIERLQAALASAANATKVAGATGQLEATEVDPELQRLEAEKAEKQALRDRKRRENAQERERLRTDRALGRAGLSSGRYGGLNVGMLEDDEEGGIDRGRPSAGKPRAKPRRRRNSEYSDDEDFGRKRFTREDSYDQEDDFVAPSDEEEVVEDDEDPDDGIVEQAREKRRPAPALSAENSGLGDDADADGEIDDDIPQQQRTKRRRVVDDDDEE